MQDKNENQGSLATVALWAQNTFELFVLTDDVTAGETDDPSSDDDDDNLGNLFGD